MIVFGWEHTEDCGQDPEILLYRVDQYDQVVAGIFKQTSIYNNRQPSFNLYSVIYKKDWEIKNASFAINEFDKAKEWIDLELKKLGYTLTDKNYDSKYQILR